VSSIAIGGSTDTRYVANLDAGAYAVLNVVFLHWTATPQRSGDHVTINGSNPTPTTEMTTGGENHNSR
jgi:hypothetical protein